MFRNIKIKLSFLCCFITALLAFALVLCCLRIAEKSMYGQEEALFFRKADDISYELHKGEPVSINWYMRHVGQNILYLEINGVPSSLSRVALEGRGQEVVEEVKAYIKEKNISPISGGHVSEMAYFPYKTQKPGYLVLYGAVSGREPCITYLYLYSLEPFSRNVEVQRIWFLGAWLCAMPAAYLFSYRFTSHALRPVVQNHEKQKNFIAFASHELRSPLAVFKTGLSVLKRWAAPEKQERIFSLMDNEMAQMERLVQDLLCLAKAEQAELGFSFAPVDLAALAEQVYGAYLGMAGQKGISLSFVKEEGCSYSCFCDAQRVEQVLVVLLDNAFCYTPSGQEVSLRLSRQRGKAVLQVADTGKGIPEGEKGKIFDKFYQADGAHSKKGHFGLGLSIAKEICKGHGGQISVSDTKGGGSTFTVKLPLKRGLC